MTRLEGGRLYVAEDRLVCGRVDCAGYTAATTGRTIAGVRVEPMTAAEAATWLREVGEAPRCECGAVEIPASR